MADVPVFPPGFLWGVAAAAYQIEGAAAEDGRAPSIWDTFSRLPGAVTNGDTGDVATDHYHRFRQDVEIMASLGIEAYRFSLAWSRLIPAGTGEPSPAGVDFYRRLCGALHEAGIVPVVTLYHWDLPQVLQDRGGWLDPRSVGWFAHYARVAKEALGDLVSTWSTLNEPWCSAFLGHSAGVHAPGLSDPSAAYVAAHHLMLAHHRAVGVLRDVSPAEGDSVGIVLNIIPARPASGSSEDAAVADAADAVQNRLFLEAVLAGAYPEEVLEHHERFEVGSLVDVGDLTAARQDIDYLGLNYYNINRFSHVPGAPPLGPWPAAVDAVLAEPPGPLTEMGWGVEPEGLTWVLERVANRAPSLPLFVCENGAAYHDVVASDGTVDDEGRRAYLEAHIGAVHRALTAGVDVRGYFVWSILDNFEWSHGYQKRFGIVRVDYETLERTVKASGRWYGEFIATQRSLTRE